MVPQGFAVAPIACLPPGGDQQPGHHRHGQDRKEPTPPEPGTGQVHGAPSQCHVDSDLRQVRIAVGPRLETNLHQAAHGNEHPQAPEPADQQAGAIPAAGPDRRGNAGQQQPGAGNRANGEGEIRIGLPMRIKHGEPRRIEKLPQVGDGGNQGVGNPRRQRHAQPDAYRAALRQYVMAQEAAEIASQGSFSTIKRCAVKPLAAFSRRPSRSRGQ